MSDPKVITNATITMDNGWVIEFTPSSAEPPKSAGGFMILPHPDAGELLLFTDI